MDHIRNFSIIAHIDHGKSTLADRLIQRCGGLSDREMEAQVLDSMDIERERGITIKAQTASLEYKARDGRTYNLNLIDTPGHVDFSYEVSRSLSACEGALLVVDASQGVEAQTVANCYTALDLSVEVIPVLNKMDLPNADPENAKAEIEDVIGIDADNAIPCSAKTGMGIDDILEAVIARMPAPRGDPEASLRAMIVDSWFDNYVGVVMLVRVVDGTLLKGERIRMMASRSGSSSPASRNCRPRKSATRSRLRRSCPTTRAWRLRRCPASKRFSRRSLRVSTRPRRANTTSCAMRSKSSSSTTPRCATNPRSAKRSASASGAAFSACCTWRSCRSGWSASSTKT